MQSMTRQDTRSIRVWDPLVRIFHWSLALLVLANLIVLEPGEWLHRMAGYAACGWVALRIAWGFIGTRHARFADFFPTPGRLAAHFRALRAGRPDTHDGHNPLGALMMLALMGLVLALGATGYLLGTDAWFGNEGLEELHEGLAGVLQGAIVLHVLAAILMSRLEKTNLVRAMVTGVKVRPASGDTL